MIRPVRSLLAVFAVLVTGLSAHAAFDRVVVFGDSLSDVGNISAATFGIVPGSGYYSGRFSNGPVWVETLAADLGLNASIRWNQTNGTNYAYGGATTAGGTSNFGFVRNIGRQIENYDSAHNPIGNELFVIWGGGNDYFDGQTNINTPVNNIANHITNLANMGAQHFLIPNLPPLGSVPDEFGNTTLTTRTLQHNALLDTTLDGLRTNLGIEIVELDIADIFDRILTNPSAFGFTNITSTGIDAPGGTDTSGYLFWDGKHPTAFAHSLLAQYAYDAVFPGDYDDSGAVGQGDLALVLQYWGTPVADGQSPDPAWIRRTSITGGLIGQDELALVLQNWGDTASLLAQVTSIVDATGLSETQIIRLIPEPATGLVVLTLLAIWVPARWRGASRVAGE